MRVWFRMVAALLLGCSADDGGTPTTTFPGIGSAGTDTTGEPGGEEDEDSGRLDLPDDSDLPPQDPEECVSETAEAELVPKPIDVVVFVDTSSSMNEESSSVEMNLNLLLGAIVEQEMADVHIIVVAPYGTGVNVCVPAPLGQDDCVTPEPMAPVGPVLFHYSAGLGSQTLLDLIEDTFTGAHDANAAQYVVAPIGWQEWARPEAFKAIIAISDAGSMSTATTPGDVFDAELLALSPEQFGMPDERNYVFHTITALGANEPSSEPWPPDAPIVTTTCGEGRPGQPLQQVSILTGGFRFPLCRYDEYAMLFDDIAVSLTALTPVECDFPIPEAPPGETLDPDTLEVEYLPAGVAPGEVFHQVPSQAACEPDAFWVDATYIHLCEDTCTIVQSDAMAIVEVRYGCDVGYDPG